MNMFESWDDGRMCIGRYLLPEAYTSKGIRRGEMVLMSVLGTLKANEMRSYLIRQA